MTFNGWRIALVLRLISCLSIAAVLLPGSTTRALDGKPSMVQAYGKLPLSFEANQGQSEAPVKFLSRGPGYTFLLTSTEAVLRTGKSGHTAIRMKLTGANPAAEVRGMDQLPGKVNYFIGNTSKQWHAGVPTYSRVKYSNVYPGVDLIYYGNQRQLEYDFVVASGADAGMIRLHFNTRLRIDESGDLMAEADGREAILHRPVMYQVSNRGKQAINGSFLLKGPHEVGFRVAEYDHRKALVIDPVLVYASYLGGSDADAGFGVAVDAAGNAYVTGYTLSPNFPHAGGTFHPSHCNGVATFVTKIDATGSTILYSTLLGPAVNTTSHIAVDEIGQAYVTGNAASRLFPTTAGAFQTHFPQGTSQTVFVSKLNSTGSLVYSTYLGGSNGEAAGGIVADSSGNAYVTGGTNSTDFPVTTGALKTTLGGPSDAFVSELNASGSALVYSTYLGGTAGADFANSIALDSSGNAYVTGQTYSADFPITPGAFQTAFSQPTAFVSKLNPNASALVYSTYLGGTGGDEGWGIALDPFGNAYVVGTTGSPDFPVTPGALQTTFMGREGFVSKLSPSGSALAYSTYLLLNADLIVRIAADRAGYAYVAGTRGSFYAFADKLNTAGSALVYSIDVGGTGNDYAYAIAVDSTCSAYVVGETGSSHFPVTAGVFQGMFGGGASDAYVTKISAAATGVAEMPNSAAAIRVTGDFDGDGKADYAVWRPSTGSWYIIPSSQPETPIIQQLGMPGDVPVPGDYDGDGKTDVAVWRPSTGTWHIIPSSDPTLPITQQWGLPGDVPVVSDFDGDKKTDYSVWRPSNGTWYIIPSTHPANPVIQQWGVSGDVPMVGDFDADGRTDVTVWRPATGTWYTLPSTNPKSPIVQQWGLPGDIPVVGDFDGDRKSDRAIWRPSTGTWYILPSSNPALTVVQQWGQSDDIPLAGDFDGDGRTDLTAWRPADGRWYIAPNGDGAAAIIQQWGLSGDIPM